MNLFSRILIVICCIFFSLGFAGLSRGADWKFYYQTEVEKENKTETQKLYFDASSIERPQKGIVKSNAESDKIRQRRKNRNRQQDETDRNGLFFP